MMPSEMNKKNPLEQLRAGSILAWKAWLQENHHRSDGVWLVFRKKGSGPVPFSYQEALDEALCYGWVDSLVLRIDDLEYARKFTPRKPTSNWSEINKKKVEELILAGRMTPYGMAKIEAARENGRWDRVVSPPEVNDELPGALMQAFQDHPVARDHYFALSQRCQREYNIWINMAKRPGTVASRVEESMRLLENGEELGLK